MYHQYSKVSPILRNYIIGIFLEYNIYSKYVVHNAINAIS